MKLKLVLLVILLTLIFFAPVSALYCDETFSAICDCRINIQYDEFDNPLTWTEVPDFTTATDWFNLYCEGNGNIKQQRTVFEIIKPACVERYESKQYQSVPESICVKCPAPDLISGWEPRQCAGTNTVYTRDVIAYYFTPEVQNCDLARYEEIKIEQEGPCALPGGGILMWLTGNWYMVIAAFTLAAVAIILYFKKFKGR